MSLGKNILKYRKKHCLSQEQLGEKLNVSRQTISNWELGETSPNSEQLKLLSKVLKISLDELLDNDYNNIESAKLKSFVEKTKKLEVWQIICLLLGSPIWLSILIALISIILAIYLVIWSLVISLWAVFISFVSVSFSFIFVGIIFNFSNLFLTGFAMISIGIIFSGLSILLFLGSKFITKIVVLLTKKSISYIKNYFFKMEVAK